MKVLIQRSKNSKVEINGKINGQIDHGYVLFVSFTYGDNEAIVDKMVKKILNLRIFEDENSKMNKSIIDVNGEILSISQFTLYANLNEGNRPSFTNSLEYEKASKLYDYFNNKVAENGLKIETGVFGSDMKVSILNDGPVTIMLDSNELFKNI